MTAHLADVVIVGGGPAGSTTASLLAARGHAVLVLDRARFPREKPCAEYCSPGVIDVLKRIGALDKIERLAPSRPRGMHVNARGSVYAQTYDDTHRALGVMRPLLDRALLEHAIDNGAKLWERCLVSEVISNNGRVSGVRARTPRGIINIEAQFVVGADGVHSTVAKSLGLTKEARRLRRLGLVARYEGETNISEYGEMHVAKKMYCGLAPVGNGVVNVGLVEELSRDHRRGPIDDYFEQRLTQIPGVVRALGRARRITPVRGVGPLAHTVKRVAGPGYLLVGDAAGFHDPFTGEGIYRALHGGELAAEAIDAALREGNNRPIGYEEARSAAFADKEAVCSLVQFFLARPRTFNYVIKRLATRPEVAGQLTGVLGDYAPAKSVLRPGYLWSLLRP